MKKRKQKPTKADGDLVITMKKSRALKLTAHSLFRYFFIVFTEKTGIKYPFDREDYATQGVSLKRKVIDKFVLNNWTVDDMIDFVNWVFENKPREKWMPRMLVYFIEDWMTARLEKFDKSKIELATVDRDEETQFLLYLGEGYFDNELTKFQYWTGLMWRWKHFHPALLSKIKERHKKSYNESTCHRLEEWEEELKKTNVGSFNPIRQFYLEFAAVREKTVGDTLKDFGREEYKNFFTNDELSIVPAHPST